jgi:hypothetical protein
METTNVVKRKGNPNIKNFGNRFTKDNQPTIRTKRESLLKKVLEKGCTEKDLIDIMIVQVEKAKDGDLNSANFVYNYMIGKTNNLPLDEGESDSITLIQQNTMKVFSSPENMDIAALLALVESSRSNVVDTDFKEED